MDSSYASSDESDSEFEYEILRIPRQAFRLRRFIYDIPDDDAVTEFRFTIREVRFMRLLLNIDDALECGNRLRCSGDEALLILLSRLSSTKRTIDIARDFDRCPSSVSLIWTTLATFLHHRWAHIIRFNEGRVAANVGRYAAAILSRGAALDNVWGFVDGTSREIARPVRDQRLFFDGHHHYHSIKFQAIVTPDGLISHLFGPVAGSRHDMFAFHMSALEQTMSTPALDDYVVFGDRGYATIGHLMSPIVRPMLTQDEASFNESMLIPRLSVEHGFMRITKLFRMFQAPSILRSRSCPVALFYELAVLFTNLRTCLDGRNQISDYFACEPCSCEELLGLNAAL